MAMLKFIFNSSHELGKAMLAQKGALLRAAGFSFVLNMLYLVPSLYMLQIYDRVLSSRNLTTLLMLTLLLIGALAVLAALDWLRAQMLAGVGVRLHQTLAKRVFDASFSRFQLKAGITPAQSVQDLTVVRQYVGGAGSLAFFDLPWIPIYLLAMGLLHPYFGLFGLGVAIVLGCLAWLSDWLTHKPLSDANQESQLSNQFLANNMRNADTVLVLGMLPAMRERWLERQRKLLGLQGFASEDAARIGAFTKYIRLLSQSLVLGLGAWLAIQDRVTPGAMIAGSILLGRALAPVELLIGVGKQWVNASEAYSRLADLLKGQPEPKPALQLPEPKGRIKLEAVSGAVPSNRHPVLHNISLSLEPGDVLLVSGPSGSGKSSLAKLLLGVWPPLAGHVRLDGADVYPWDKQDLGPKLGYLPQEMGLFEGTVAENIARYGKLDSEAIVKAAQLAGVHELILKLPQGYATSVGVEGSALSGGQRQRIALARAVYGSPALVVLDEPNSNLDQAGEAALLAAVSTMSQNGVTVVLIAHHQGLLQVANKLLVLRDGATVVFGPKEKALAFMKEQAGKSAAPSGQSVPVALAGQATTAGGSL